MIVNMASHRVFVTFLGVKRFCELTCRPIDRTVTISPK